MNEKTCYTVAEAGKILGVRGKAVRDLIKKGCFKAVFIGNRYMIIRKSMEEWLDGPGAEEIRKYLGESEEVNMEEKRCYTVKDLQDMLGISRQAVYSLIKRGEFNTVVIAGKHCVSKRGFDAWLDGMQTEKKEPERVK